MDSMLKIRHPFWDLWKEKHVTKHISGLFGNYFDLTYEQFKHKLYLTVYDVPAIEIFNQDKIPILQYWHKLVDFDWLDVPIDKDFDYWLKDIDLYLENNKNETDN